MIVVSVQKDSSTPTSLVLYNDGLYAKSTLNRTERFTLTDAATDELLLDSDISTDVVDWSLGKGKVAVRLGEVPGLVSDTRYVVLVQTYDVDNPSGIFWGKFAFIVN